MSGQPWPQDLKAQAKALYLADGSKLAAEVTSIPRRTIQRWAVAEGWGASPDATDATDPQAADQAFAPFAAPRDGAIPQNGDGAMAPVLPSLNPTRDLAVDLAMGRLVYRTTVDRYRSNRAKASEVRDAAAALTMLQDKAAKAGVSGAHGGDFDWRANRAQARDNIPRLRAWVAAIKERIAAEGGSWTV